MIHGERFWRLLLAAAVAVGVCATASASAADSSTNLAPPAAELAKRIAAISGPGPARLTVRNRSSLTTEQTAAVRKLLERDLRGLGVAATDSSADGATAIQVTLSANSGGGLWVAEVREGADARVAMVPATLDAPGATQPEVGVTLSKTPVWRQREPVLDALMLGEGSAQRMIVLEPERIASYAAAGPGATGFAAWKLDQEFAIVQDRPYPREARGRLFASATTGSGRGFEAYLPGIHCSGDAPEGKLAVACAESDDPWPIEASATISAEQIPGANSPLGSVAAQKAFYNSGRNYFTGVLSPGVDLRLPAFYQAAALSSTNGRGDAMALSLIDGKVAILENGALKRLAGTRDWGSDLAAIRWACGTGEQLLTSASGAGPSDSLRAYEIHGLEAEPVSAPMDAGGAVTAMWPSDDSRRATMVVRSGGVAPAAGSGQAATAQSGTAQAAIALPEEYEVYSVAAHCN
jgi:hypothetical protein